MKLLIVYKYWRKETEVRAVTHSKNVKKNTLTVTDSLK